MHIAVPYFPGSNGDIDVLYRIAGEIVEGKLKGLGMEPVPLYFHYGDDVTLEKNAKLLRDCDGAVLPGGFPYEDRLGFGIIPSRIGQFTYALHNLVDSGKPVIAFCAGNQMAHAMGLAFREPILFTTKLISVAVKEKVYLRIA